MSSIHGHEVLHMMEGNSYSEASLLEAINTKFGADAVFHTCSKTDMTAKQLIEFLTLKGKFIPSGESNFTVNVKKICQHG